MAIAKVIFNDEVLMDVTTTTVTEDTMTENATAIKNDGTEITGTLPEILPAAGVDF